MNQNHQLLTGFLQILFKRFAIYLKSCLGNIKAHFKGHRLAKFITNDTIQHPKSALFLVIDGFCSPGSTLCYLLNHRYRPSAFETMQSGYQLQFRAA